MKKLICLLAIMLVFGIILSGCSDLVVPQDESLDLSKTKPTTVKPPSGAHYNLNIIGKKADWSGQGSYDNPDRHTMFVPEDTTGYIIPTPGDVSGVYPVDTPDGVYVAVPDLNGIKINVTQGDEFAVLDGNAFDDGVGYGECAFQIGPGKYEVWITVKAKPPKEGEAFYTDITGWVFGEDTDLGNAWYLNIGTINVTKKKGWQDATHIFYVADSEDPFDLVGGTDLWVFDYLGLLKTETTIDEASYFWQYDNHGNKLVKVRFYED
jgi:hypothetical protein